MNPLALVLLTACLAVSSAGAGTITGRVHAEGKSGAGQEAQSGNYDSRAFRFVERVDYTAMHDFVVYLEGPVGPGKAPTPDQPVQVDTRREVSQKKATFIPHVLPVLVGTTVEWPNHDDIFHNVFSYSDTKPFDLGLYKAPDLGRVTFDKPGRVDIFCSIHSGMSCVVLVLENPYFAATNPQGGYSIPNVPAGVYKLKAWHERMPAQVKEVTVPAIGEVKADFTLGITGLPKY